MIEVTPPSFSPITHPHLIWLYVNCKLCRHSLFWRLEEKLNEGRSSRWFPRHAEILIKNPPLLGFIKTDWSHVSVIDDSLQNSSSNDTAGKTNQLVYVPSYTAYVWGYSYMLLMALFVRLYYFFMFPQNIYSLHFYPLQSACYTKIRNCGESKHRSSALNGLLFDYVRRLFALFACRNTRIRYRSNYFVRCRGGGFTLSVLLVVLLRNPLFPPRPLLLLFWLPQCSLTSEWPRAVPPQECAAEDAQRPGGARGWRTTTIQNKGVCAGFEHTEARTLHIPPSICSVHEFTSGGHQAGFTTGQQKHVIHRRTPYLGAYVRENQVHVPLISIIHHKLCKGAIGRAKAYEPQIKHTGLCCLTCNTIKGDNI